MKTDREKAKEFEKEFWADYYVQCKKCVHDCKQSHMILDLYCPKFKEK